MRTGANVRKALTVTAVHVWLLSVALPSSEAAQKPGGEAPRPAGLEQTPVAVLRWTAATPDPGRAWVGTAAADLIARSLVEAGVPVVERENLNRILAEVDLGQTGLTASDRALRTGRVARVRRVLFGAYELRGNALRLTAAALDPGKGEVMWRGEAGGPLSSLSELATRLVREMKAGREGPADGIEAGVGSIGEQVPAMESFYRGLDLYDRGFHARALGRFAAALARDPGYRQAELWMGRVFESLDRDDQAEARYRALSRQRPFAGEAVDALFLLGRLRERRPASVEGARVAYRGLMGLEPPLLHSVQAAFRLGVLAEKEEKTAEAYRAYLFVVETADRVRGSRVHPAGSRLFSWREALDLRKEAAARLPGLYRDLLRLGAAPSPPPGIFLATADQPLIPARAPGRPLIQPSQTNPRWGESMFAVVTPPGWTAAGVRASLTGQLHESRPYYSYDLRILPLPLPRQYLNRYLGAIHGQTPTVETLHKDVSFFGQAKDRFFVHLLEFQATVQDWRLTVDVVPEGPERPLPEPPVSEAFWEGRPLVTVPLPGHDARPFARPFHEDFFFPRRELDMTRLRGGASILVVTRGELDGGGTDLDWSVSENGTTWSPWAPFPGNSAGQDYDPRLVAAEDGGALLAWISDRRGLGWELWMSRRSRAGAWSDAFRVPLEIHVATRSAAGPAEPGDLLEYDVHQDRRGSWWVVAGPPGSRETLLLTGRDLSQWSVAARLPGRLHGPALRQDEGGTYVLAGFPEDGKLLVGLSPDGRSWRTRERPVNRWSPHFAPFVKGHRVRLFDRPGARTLALFSDRTYGLQFGTLPKGEAPLRLDLVARASLQPFAAVPWPDGETRVALRDEESVTIRRYRDFTVGAASDADTDGWPIYVDRERDAQGHTWDLIHAEARDRMSDVTAVAAEPGGRIWWGIEAGLMFKDDRRFFAMDVSKGFFNHYVDRLATCADGSVWLGATLLDPPVLGRTSSPDGGARFVFSAVPLAGGRGPMADLTCDPRGGAAAVTKGGQLYRITRDGPSLAHNWREPIRPTSVAAGAGALWVGTREHGIWRAEGDTARRVEWPENPPPVVRDLAVGSRGELWVATVGRGLHRMAEGRWERWDKSTGLLYDDIGQLAADPDGGVWYIADDRTPSTGLGRVRGGKPEAFYPPHRWLAQPVGLAVDGSGTVWVGTAYDGIYRFQRKGP